MQIPRDLKRLGQFQYGLLTRAQLLEAGFGPRQRRKLAVQGVVESVNHRVVRAFGTPPAWEQDLLAACLSAGSEALASHRAAALLWDLAEPPVPIELTVPYRHRPLPMGTIRHRTRCFREVDRAVRRRIPVTTPARTLLDLGAVAPHLLSAAIERCLHSRLLTTAALWRILDEVGGRGRSGTTALRDALQQRSLGEDPPMSLLETVLADVAASTGTTFAYQHPVTLDGCRYVLDFAVPDLLLGLEADGLIAHATRDALDHDLRRQNRLVGHGWLVLRYTSTHLRQRREGVRPEVVQAVEKRRQLVSVERGGGDAFCEPQRRRSGPAAFTEAGGPGRSASL